MQIVAYIWMYVCAYSLFIGLNVVSTKCDKKRRIPRVIYHINRIELFENRK